MTAPRPWLGISASDWFINSDAPQSISVWVALLDDQDTARRHLAATAPELNFATQLTTRIAQVQDALTSCP